MKRWMWCLGALILAAGLGGIPFAGTDVGKLQPVELIRVSRVGDRILVETDTGDRGTGADLAGAFEDLKQTTSGQVFLDTAEYLLVSPAAEGLLPELSEYLRPACGVCLERGKADLEQAAAYLSAHEPKLTLQDYRAGERGIPTLTTRKGEMHLVS